MADSEIESGLKIDELDRQFDDVRSNVTSLSRASVSSSQDLIGVVAPNWLLKTLKATSRVISVTPDDLSSLQLDALLLVPAPHTSGGDAATAIAGWPELSKEWVAAIEDARKRHVLIGIYDLGWSPDLRDAKQLLEQVDFALTTSPLVFDSWRKQGVDETRAFFLPLPIDGEIFNPIQSESQRKPGLVYNLPVLESQIPAPTRRTLAGSLSSGMETHLTRASKHMRTSRGQGRRIADGIISRIESSSTFQEFKRWNTNSEFAVSDRIDPSPDGMDPGILNFLASGAVVFSDYTKFVNGAFPSVLMAETSEDFIDYVNNVPNICRTLSRIEGVRNVFNNFTPPDWVRQFREKVLGETTEAERVIIVSPNPQQNEHFRASQLTNCRLEIASSIGQATELLSGEPGIVVFADRIEFSNPNLVNDIRAAFRYSSASELRVIAADDPGRAYELEPTECDASTTIAADPHAICLNASERAGASITIRTDVLREPGQLLAGTDRTLAQNRLSIVVPVFNNGPHLFFKCLQSLWRASTQKHADIVIVDDGSTDPQTLHILDLLDSADSSIKVLRLPTGGSGSAARPRNSALDSIDTPYVTFLDPDDEQMGHGYKNLLDAIEFSGSDIAVGNTVVRRGGRVWVGNVPNIETGLTALGIGVDNRGKYILGGDNTKLLTEINFQPFSIQATIARTDFLRENKLRQVEGAFGEDSLFSLQMLYAAKSISFARNSIFVYNAEVPGSAVNSVSTEFFRKSLASEREQVNWLRELDLLNAYSERRFMKMMNVWYLQKIKETREEERQESLALIHQIAELYGPAITRNADYIKSMEEAGFDLFGAD